MRRLLIRPGAIGDCILSLPALRHVAGADDEVWISSRVAPLIQFAGRVRELSATGIDLLGLPGVEPPEALIQQLRTFDEVISWYGANRPEFREVLNSVTARCHFRHALPPPDYPGHATDFFAQQVGAPLGLAPSFPVPAVSSRNTVVIHPFSGSASKNWPLASFQALAKRFDSPVEWIAGPHESLEGAISIERLDILAAWVTGARLYIGNDSGITHLAAALGVRTQALFGPTSPQLWAPRGQNVSILHAQPLDALTVDAVFNRLLDLRWASASSAQSASAPL